jgi:hypothetical protein
MARQVFYSFHYDNDNWRASQVRNIGVIEGNRAAGDNDWEAIKRGGDAAIQKWIDNQLYHRSCTIVLVGAATSGRKWINYEIEKSWKEGKGVVGISIHGLKDRYGNQSYPGSNPFSSHYINGIWLSNAIKLYSPPYTDSKDVYNYISNNIVLWADEAVSIRNKY